MELSEERLNAKRALVEQAGFAESVCNKSLSVQFIIKTHNVH